MTNGPAPREGRTGLIGKRQAILSGSLTVFARDGYTRASIDAIAAVAGVSTRTIYNHFADKAALFEAVITHSASEVARAHVDQIDEHLSDVDSAAGLADALAACTLGMLGSVPGEAEHWALLRHVQADAAHIPQEAIDAWRRSGPRQVQRELAARLRELGARGLLQVDDADLAAEHLTALVNTARPSHLYDGQPRSAEELVVAGVHTFLHGYLSVRRWP